MQPLIVRELTGDIHQRSRRDLAKAHPRRLRPHPFAYQRDRRLVDDRNALCCPDPRGYRV